MKKLSIKVWFWNWRYTGKLNKTKVNFEKLFCTEFLLETMRNGDVVYIFNYKGISRRFYTKQIKKIIIERI